MGKTRMEEIPKTSISAVSRLQAQGGFGRVNDDNIKYFLNKRLLK